jgi:hypothetical protein
VEGKGFNAKNRFRTAYVAREIEDRPLSLSLSLFYGPPGMAYGLTAFSFLTIGLAYSQTSLIK